MGNTISETQKNEIPKTLRPDEVQSIDKDTLQQLPTPQQTQEQAQAPTEQAQAPPEQAQAPTIVSCRNLNSNNCNNKDKCYYINNSCKDKNEVFSLNDIHDNKIKCSITISPDSPNLFILECINTNFIKDILIKGLIIDNSCLYNYEDNNYLYNKKCNALLSDNILINKEFKIKKEIITFNNISGKLTISPILNKLQVNKIKSQNNVINLIDIYNNKVQLNVDIYDNLNNISQVKKDIFFYNKNLDNIHKIKQNISNIISN